MNFTQYTEQEKINLIESNGYAVRKSKVTAREGRAVSTSYVNFAYKSGIKYSVDDAFDAVVLLLLVDPAGGGGAYTGGDGIDITGVIVSADFAGSGAATTVSRSDHLHAGVYDLYESWKLQGDNTVLHGGADVTSGDEVLFEGGDYITTVQSDTPSKVIINYTGAQPINYIPGDFINIAAGEIEVDVYASHFMKRPGHEDLFIVGDGHAHTIASITGISNAGSGIIISDAERTKLSGIATGADLYNAWDVYVDGGLQEPVTSGFNLNFVGGDYIDISYAGQAITIDYVGAQPISYTPGDFINIAAGEIEVDVYASHFMKRPGHEDLFIINDGHAHTGASISALNTADITAGILGVARGGTGLGTIGANYLLTGNGTGAMTAEANLLFTGTVLAVATNEVFHEGHEAWQTDAGGAATWNMATSRNFEWTMTGSNTLTISNADNGSSGVLILRANGSYTATLPANSTPASLIVTASNNVLAVFTRVNNGNYIWNSSTFLDPV